MADAVAVHQAGAQTPSVKRFALSQKPASRRTADVVATISELLGKLADGIAPLIAE